jgi:hypothetical protein
MNHEDIFDFLMLAKAPRGSSLVWHLDGVDYALQKNTRYYVAQQGGEIIKIMPPLAKSPNQWRRIAIEKGWSAQPCNRIEQATMPVNHDYYIQEVEKLCLGLH